VDRVKQNTAVTISNTWYADGVVVDPGAVTIGVTRDDGTVLVAAGTATGGGGAAARTFNLTTTHTGLLDVLTATWTSPTRGLDTTRHEIVGDFLFTVAQARAVSPLGNTATYTTQAITDARTMVETALEDACGVAFVPRYKRERVSGMGGTQLLLSMPRVRAIRSVTLDGVAVTDAATIVNVGSGVAYYPTGWTRGYGNYEVAYEHGHDYPPPRVSQAALLWCKAHLVKGPIDDRTTSFSTDDGTFALATPGLRGSWTGIPEVDAVIQQYGMQAAIA
jgi:hypothetical protein